MIFPLLLVLAGLLLYLPYLGAYGPLDPTDSFFIESAREMLEKNEYLLPMFNYQLWLDKPVFFFWLIILFYKLFGLSVLSARLVSPVVLICTSLFVFFSIKNIILKPLSRFLVAIIFLSSPLIAVFARTPLSDTVLMCLNTVTVISLYQLLFTNNKFWDYLFYLFLALTVLCKGPISLILIFLLWIGQKLWSKVSLKDQLFSKLFRLGPILLFFIVLVPWYLLAIINTNGQFFYKFFIEQNFGRMVGHVNHQQPIWFYVPILILGFLPYNLFLIYYKKFIGSANDDISHLTKFFMSWSLICITLFSLVPTKLPTYIEPANIGISVLCALIIGYLYENSNLKVFSIISVIIAAISFVVGSGFINLDGLTGIVIHNLHTYLLISAVVFLITYFIKPKYKLTSFFLSMIFALAIILPNIFLTYYDTRQIPFNNIVKKIQQSNGNAAIIFAEQPSIQFYLHKPIKSIKSPEQMMQYLNNTTSPRYLIVPKETTRFLKWTNDCQPHFILQLDKWMLYSI